MGAQTTCQGDRYDVLSDWICLALGAPKTPYIKVKLPNVGQKTFTPGMCR